MVLRNTICNRYIIRITKRKKTREANLLLEHMKNKQNEQMEQFDEKYQVTLDELAANDGTGKKFGR